MRAQSTSDERRSQLVAIASGAGLALATAAFVLWQNCHVAVLWDLSYLLDSAWRFSLGQPMYRNLPFAHAPLTFLVQAAIIHLTGRVYWHHVVYACVAGATGTLLAWRILLKLLRDKLARPEALALLLALPLIPLGIASIYPHPIYDSDAILSILFALFCLLRVHSKTHFTVCILTGAALVPPLFFKQNIGLFFLPSAFLAVLAVALGKHRQGRSWRSQFAILAGATLTLCAAVLVIHLTAGLSAYVQWTFGFAAHRRLPGLSLILGSYHQTSLLWSLPATGAGLLLLRRWPHLLWSRGAGFLLIALPFLVTLVSLPLLEDVPDRTDQLLSLWPHVLLLSITFTLYQIATCRRHPVTFQSMLPIMLLATIHGTFLSQQLWGSTYALWPLLMLLIAGMLVLLGRIAVPLTATVAVTFTICGFAYALSHDRLSYIYLDGIRQGSNTPSLAGMTTPGPWLPILDELLADTRQKIPFEDPVLLFPGQVPFFYATGREPQFPVLLFDPATNPYSPGELAQAVRNEQVRWLILPRSDGLHSLQLTEPPLTNYDDYITVLMPLFRLDHVLTGYAVYRRQ